ncbi:MULTISPECIES: hypothetical protein [Deefgea]|uniref:Uncharacterized protein n=1 Tax=Deefgea chitinilytica TaxID=570276 RepID=A0ABS2CF26_9NEIS|nr:MULTISPECIES: hypothetical protein [Deefgea]MBM5572759.1 hypothetical protein [Deefgea chitinilytica]MBM9889995.1 hypothetical protein [Deefgea sp. CFH1-16]
MTTWLLNQIDSIKKQLAAHAGKFYGITPSPAEAVVLAHGNSLLALGYAALYFPEISIIEGIPYAKFATANKLVPIDCVHVDLLHHNNATGSSPEIYSALGNVLSTAWNLILRDNSLNGNFKYDASTGFDVVFKP